VAMLTETARPTAAASTTDAEPGALGWLTSMCAAFGLLGIAIVRDRVVSWVRPSRRPAAPTSRRRSGGPASGERVTRCGRPPAR
jgi:hypothetical protein